MVETTSLREEKPKLSARDRLCLIQTINALPPTQFDELVFALDPPKGVVASNSAAQGQRSKALLDWLEGSSGPGLTAADEVLQILIPKATETAPQPVAFVMMGRMGDLTPSELEAIVELLRQKTGDDSISLAFSKEGSIKAILNGSPEGLTKLREMFEAGELEQLDIPTIEAINPVDSNSQDARKARLIQALSLRGHFSVTLANAIAIAIDRDSDRDLDRDLGLDRDLSHARALARDLARDSTSDSASALARDLARVLARARARARTLASDSDRDRDSTSASALASFLTLASDFALTSYSDSAFARARALDLALDLARVLAGNLARARDLDGADLSGANLRNINLTGVDLTGADLSYADVTGTIFGDNPGLTEADKRDLQSRGAIFLDPPSSDVPALALR